MIDLASGSSTASGSTGICWLDLEREENVVPPCIGHASNLIIRDGELAWTGDNAQIETYKLPESQRFGRTFCNQCGGPLPREGGDTNLIFVPAGTLDDEPNIAPEAHIFQNSKAAWSCTGDEVPCFGEYAG